jgi:SCF-associated factor 1
MLALDNNHNVHLFTSWGTPVRIVSPLIADSSSFVTKVIQVEAGWYNFALLTESGTVYVQWPFAGSLPGKILGHQNQLAADHAGNLPFQALEGTRRVLTADQDGVVACLPWEINHDLFELLAIPLDLPNIGTRASKDPESIKLIKIAAGDNFVIGLNYERRPCP